MTLSNPELNNLGIRQWSDLQTKHEELDLLLGNGFSINFSGKFRYGSIYEKFQEKCAPLYKQLFAQFETTNFEEIMLMLTYAKRVNNVFELSTAEIASATEELKNGLIESINEVHPRYADVSRELIHSISQQFLAQFKDIYSLSYDLILYKIIMDAYNEWEQNTKLTFLQDYCWGKRDTGSRYREWMDYQSRDNHNSVYYIHGNLALFNNNYHIVKRIRDDNDPREAGVELIELIARSINKGNFPLFVSEGTTEEKKKRIISNKYLNFCFNKLGSARKPMMIFGLTLAPNDMHIVNQIKSRPRPIIISVYPEGRTELELQKELTDHRFKFGNDFRQPIDFVDSRSVFNFN